MKLITRFAAAVVCLAMVGSPASFARGGHGGGKGTTTHHGAAAPGTGSKTKSEHVRGYTTKTGKPVVGHDRSTPDKSFNNNWTTKGNQNPKTGKNGTRVTPPAK